MWIKDILDSFKTRTLNLVKKIRFEDSGFVVWCHDLVRYTPSISEIIWVRNVRAIVVCGFFMKSLKKHILKIWKKSWVLFGSYLLDSTADSAQFEWKWAGLAVLFSRYLPNGTHDFFQNFRIRIFKDFIKNPQTTIALTFLTHIISGIDGVTCFLIKKILDFVRLSGDR